MHVDSVQLGEKEEEEEEEEEGATAATHQQVQVQLGEKRILAAVISGSGYPHPQSTTTTTVRILSSLILIRGAAPGKKGGERMCGGVTCADAALMGKRRWIISLSSCACAGGEKSHLQKWREIEGKGREGDLFRSEEDCLPRFPPRKYTHILLFFPPSLSGQWGKSK